MEPTSISGQIIIRSLAACKWSTTQALVMEISRIIEVLQFTTYWNLTTKPIITRIKELQLQCRNLNRNASIDLAVVKIQSNQALGEHHLGQIKLQQFPQTSPRSVYCCSICKPRTNHLRVCSSTCQCK